MPYSWKDLSGNYSKVSTPKTLRTSLKAGKKKGHYFIYGFSVPYKVIRENKSMWVVSTERLNRKGGSASGIFYVNKKNPKKAIWD